MKYSVLQVTENSSLIYSTSYTREAAKLSFAEVVCPIVSSYIGWKENYIARGYTISIANDGVHFGESDAIVIFDSACVNCTKIGDYISCLQDVSYT